MKKVAPLPTLVTLGNVFCGFLAISYTGDAVANPEQAGPHLVAASWMILLAMVFDALDGKVARWTRGTSEFGAQLDSLSDIVSFGVAPAFLAKVFLETYWWDPVTSPHGARMALMFSVLFVVCSALRLARYNTTAHETGGAESPAVDFFRGLPTPGAAAALAVLTIFYFEIEGSEILAVLYPILVPVLSYLMVSRFPYPHVANKLLKGRRKFTQVVQIMVLGVIVAFFTSEFLAVAFTGYLLWGPVAVVVRRVRRRRDPAALGSILNRRNSDVEDAAVSSEGGEGARR